MAARAADAKLGQDTVVLAMGDFLGVTDAFVITSGANSRQVRTIVEEVERPGEASRAGRSPRATEGLRDLTWVLMDYGDFLVHVFQDEARAYYDLERLWGNAPRRSADGACGPSAAAPRTDPLDISSRPEPPPASRRDAVTGPRPRTAPWWPPGPGPRWPRAPPRVGPSSSKVTPVTPGQRRRGEHDLGHRLDLGRPDELAEGPAQVHRGGASGDVGAEDRGLGREGALQPRRRLGVGGPGQQGPEHGGQVGRGHRHVARHRHEVTGRADAGRSARGPRWATAPWWPWSWTASGARRSKGMPWRDRAAGCLSTGTPQPARPATTAPATATTARRPVRRRDARQSHDRPGRPDVGGSVSGSHGATAARVVVPGGQLDDETVLAVGTGLGPHPPAVQSHVLGHERQPQTRAVGHPSLARGLAPVEALEDPVALTRAPRPGPGRPPRSARRGPRRVRPPVG